jgi:hypothetical protein
VKRLPTSVVVVAIAGLAYAGIDVLGTAANFLMWVFKMNMGVEDPGLEFAYHDTVMGVFTVATAVLTVPFTAWLVAGCMGSLRLRPWAWKAMIWFAWVNLVMMVVLGVAHVTVLMPRVLAQYPPGPAHTMALVEDAGSGLLMLVPVGLSVAILVIYRRGVVRDAFAGTGPAAARPFPVEVAGECGNSTRQKDQTEDS